MLACAAPPAAGNDRTPPPRATPRFVCVTGIAAPRRGSQGGPAAGCISQNPSSRGLTEHHPQPPQPHSLAQTSVSRLFLVFLRYQVYYEYPLLTYLEYPILIAQDFVLLLCVFRFSGNVYRAAPYVALFVTSWFLLTLQKWIIDLAVNLCTFISAASKFAQLQCLWKTQDSGAVSVLTWGLASYTSARPQNTPARDRLPHAASFSTNSRGRADRHGKSNEIPIQDVGSHRPLFSFHNSIYNWGPNFKHLHTDPPGNNEKSLSSFIEISDAVFQYHTKLYVFMYIETDKRLHNFLPDASH
ncbi:solute carrier family 66 member 3 isoform X2 [Myotis myotis]|uniref:solute carrier family 66 member 3 isoform X2 n=1 Tax=Myotis myotis TaxID=51298 RepID=UPI00174975E6|nr:solute carrier family 66 member 3 isoform X2 [Myotis myotis]